MVKIRTSPNETSGTKKVTIADLNQNIVNLTKTMKEATALLNKSTNMPSSPTTGIKDSKNTSSSSTKTEHSWYYKAGNTAWQNSELKKQSSNIGSTYIGGLTGINPAIIQGLGIDKAIGSILKSTVSGIKKKWAEAGFGGSNNKKVNSAIESNKNVGVTKRLDKIIKLMGKDKKATKVEKEKEEGFIGKLLNFLGSFLGPLMKIAAGAALLAGISRAVHRILHWLGKNVPPSVGGGTVAGTVSSMKNNTAKALPKVKEGLERTSTKIKNVEESIRDINEWDRRTRKFTPAERAKALSSEKELERIAREKGYSAEEIEELKASRRTLHENAKTIKENYSAKERAKLGKTIANNTKKPYNWVERNLTPKTANGVPVTRSASGLRLANSVNRAGDATLRLTNYGLDKAGKLAPWVAIGLTGLEYANAETQEEKNQAIAGGAGAWFGGAKAGAAGYALNPLSKSPNPWAQGLAIAGGVATAIGGGDVIGEASRAGMEGYDMWRNKNMTAIDKQEEYGNKALEISKKVKAFANTFNQPIVGEDDEWKWWAYTKRYVPIVDPALWKAGGYQTGIWAAQARDWWENRKKKNDGTLDLSTIDPSQSVSYPEYTTDVLKLNSDFAPSHTADIKSPFSTIENNTSNTNEILKDILNAIEGNGNDIRSGNWSDFINNGSNRGNFNSSTIKAPPSLREH